MGKIIRSLREAIKSFRSGLEQRAGISREYLSRLESDDLPTPALKTAQRIAEGLGVEPVAFLTTIRKPGL